MSSTQKISASSTWSFKTYKEQLSFYQVGYDIAEALNRNTGE